MSHCIWGLLSVRQLEFVHVSGYTRKLKGQSLYQLIHQEELLLARRDITKFITENKFGGSITRCRIRDFTCRSDWLIMDIILYVATKDLLLCFLHRQDTKGECTILNEQEAVMNIRENLTHQEQLLSPSLSTSSSLSSNNSEEVETFHLPYQYFHIINNKYKSVLLTWPDYYPNDNTTILDDRFSPQRTSCLCCVQPPPRLNSLGQRVQTLKIHHGPLTFILFNVKLNSSDSFVVSSQQRKPVKHYQPYFIDPPSNKQQQYQRCQSCGTDSSPEWRRGPTGHKTLCNACGLRYSRSVVRQEKLARQQQFAMFQSPHYHPDAYPFHH